MAIDFKRVSEGPMSEKAVERFSKGGWGLFAKTKGRDWKCYFLDGEEGIIHDEAIAREMYEIALKSPECEAAQLVRIEPLESFNRA